MIAGDVPMQLTPADVWQLTKDRFNPAEIAYLAGVSVTVAEGMVAEATPVHARPAYGLEQAA